MEMLLISIIFRIVYSFICVAALYAVKIRAEAMQKASELVPSGMLSVIGRPQAQYKYACVQAKEYCQSLGMEKPICSVANYLFPDGRVIAGHREVYTKTSFTYLWLYLSSFLTLSVRISHNVHKERITEVCRTPLDFSCIVCLFRLWISYRKTQDVSIS